MPQLIVLPHVELCPDGAVIAAQKGVSLCDTLLENGIEITVVQMLLGHASLNTTAGYLHVRAERLAQIQSPLGLLDLKSPLIPA